MAFVVILHLSPTHESHVAEILQRSTRMTVCQVQSDMPIEKNRVYVIPPTHDLTMSDGHLSLSVREQDKLHGSVDLFFRTLAVAHKQRAVGVVLSGTGSDGSVGLAQIKEQGGVVIAQSPGDAEHGGMPQSAIATGKVDFVLPVVDIADKLLELWANAREIELPTASAEELRVRPPTSPDAAEAALRSILSSLKLHTGHDFTHYKRGTVLRRIERRLQVRGVKSLPEYAELLAGSAEEGQALFSDMLIGVTQFFRDLSTFEALERDLVPALFEGAGDAPIRVWIAGCSTGEEAYSVAALLTDAQGRAQSRRPIRVFASDIDEGSLAFARRGRYPGAIAADVPPGFLRRYFDRAGEHFQIKEVVRRRVTFARHNLLRDPPFSRVDMVFCRNLLIYVEGKAQRDILQAFHFALNPGGLLVLGSAETPDAMPRLFETVDRPHHIYRSTLRVRGLAHLPSPEVASVGPTTASDAVPKAPLSAGPSMEELHRRAVFDDTSLATVLVDIDLQVLHTSPGAGLFLRFPGGSPSRDLLQLVRPELRSALQLAVFEVPRSTEPVEATPLRLDLNGRLHDVRMVLRKPALGSRIDLILVRFMAELVPPAETSTANDGQAARWGDALRRKDEQLDATVAQYGVATESLRTSNEELQALNEELQSASEELETSKEELQSTNEELTTVNAELRARVDHTMQVNDDWQNLLRASEIATIFVDEGMRIKRFSPATTSIFNLIESDVGRSLLDITHKLDYASLAADATETFRSLRMVEREVRCSDGRWFLARSMPYRTAEDRIGGAVLIFVDISSRVVAESRMHLGEERLQLVTESLPEFAILTLDEQGTITSWSKGARALFGYGEAEIVGQPFGIIFTAEDQEAGVPAREMEKAARAGRCPDERWHQRKDGTRFLAGGVLARLTMGKLQGFAKIAHDITELRLRLDENLKAADAAQAAMRLKDEFLAVMSHELKHPLNLIHINAQLLVNLPETKGIAPVRRAVDAIERSVSAQVRIIDDLLDLSRTKAGKMALQLAPLELVQALGPSIRWAEEQAQSRGLELAVSLPDEGVYVEADAVRIEQVVMNLLSNAMKFTASGGRIAVRLREEGDEAILEVADNGRGISAEFLPHVFGMFEQEDRGPSRREGGLGIGLGLAQELMLLQGGRIDAASPGTGLGATFSLHLPLHERSDLVPLDAIEPAFNPLAGLHILIVDDDPDAVESFGMVLELQGASVRRALSGAEALHICESERFDLIISDIGMPMMDGSELIAQMRRRAATKWIPAIALTGYGRPQDVQRALSAGFTAHLTKPVDLNKLSRLAAELKGQRH